MRATATNTKLHIPHFRNSSFRGSIGTKTRPSGQKPSATGSAADLNSSPSERSIHSGELRSTNLASGSAGSDQGDDPNQRSPGPMAAIHDVPVKRAGSLVGIAILSDSQGWKQKLHMSYRLAVRPDCEVGDEATSSVYTRFSVNNIEIRVAQATFENERRQPQFRIKRTTISAEPTIEGLSASAAEEHRDRWYAIEQNPTRQEYIMMPGLRGNEFSVAGQLQISANPSASVELARKHSSSRNTHPLTAVINLDKSAFHATPHGGLTWGYEIQLKDQESEGFLRLDTHSGTSVVPKSNLPSKIETKVESIFDIVNNRGIGFPNFGNRSTYRGISIGYRQCKIVLKVAVPWEGDRVTRYPNLEKPSSGHQLCIRHQFRGGCENTIQPEKASFRTCFHRDACGGEQIVRQ